VLNADLIRLSALVSGLMNDLKERSLPEGLAAALKDHLPSTYCVLMLLDVTRNLTTWMACPQNALPAGLHIGAVFAADRMTTIRAVLDAGEPVSYQLESDTKDNDLRTMLAPDTSSVLIVPLRIHASNSGVMIFGYKRQGNNRTVTHEQIESAFAITGQIALILTLCSCFERSDERNPRFQPSLDKITGTTSHASLREVTQSVEHEINNPLSVIVNWSEVYREDASIDPELRKTFQIIYDMSMRIMEVVRKLSEMQDHKSTGFVNRTSDE
jgi:hypothetical protein